MNRGTQITQEVRSDDLLPVFVGRPALPETAREISLPRAAATYLMFKRRRLTPSSERGYKAVLDELTINHPGLTLADLEPPQGAILIEDFLTARWGESAPRTYNKAHSVLCDFFSWHLARGTLLRDPMGTIERAKARPVHRTTFSVDQRAAILAANPDPRDQIALRLLLDYGIRKGALRGVRFHDFDVEKRQLTVFTKGEKIQTLPPMPDPAVWENLALLGGERRDHYLLPKRVTRKRIPPRKKELLRLEAALGDAHSALTAAADDQACARELAHLLETISLAATRYDLVVEAASTQTRFVLDEQIGEHGAHLWWYRCLARAGVVDRGVTAGQRMHKARHSAGQRILDATGNLKAAQVVLGHATLSTTGDNYVGWDDHQAEESLRRSIPGLAS